MEKEQRPFYKTLIYWLVAAAALFLLGVLVRYKSPQTYQEERDSIEKQNYIDSLPESTPNHKKP